MINTRTCTLNRRCFIRNTTVLGTGLVLSSPSTFAASLESDLTALTANTLSAAIREKHTSCVEVMEAYLQRIHRYNPIYNAIVSLVDDDDLLSQARAADQELARGQYRGWMHGMPHAVKDLMPVAGLPHTSGSPIFAERIAETDSAMVARIREAGAIFIGKTNTPEFGLGSQSYNPVFGTTGSAYNPTVTSGGSSGGAASGLGTRMLPVADGSDMMGSLRNPGAYNNVIGYRPSTSVMSDNQSATRPLSTPGPMGRNTLDTIRLLETVAVNPIGEDIEAINLQEIKIGWLGNLDNYLAMQEGVIDLCESSLTTLEDAGVSLDSVSPRFTMSDLWQSWTTLRHSIRVEMQDYYDNPKTHAQLKPELIWEIEQSMTLTDDDRLHANVIRQNWYLELDRLFDEYDFLALPSAQVFPYPKTMHWPTEISGRQMDTYHRWMEVVILGSLGGIPVVNVPVGFDGQGRPMGMQVMGRFGTDRKVLSFALAYEAITNHLQQAPALIEA
ncbi:MAG: amidase [Arenicellaceae bacterium]|nr:amidase [Arenicellaceae bacterium]